MKYILTYNNRPITMTEGAYDFIEHNVYRMWVPITFTGLNSIYGEDVWTDGTNTYYSRGSTQYVYDKTNRSWNTKTWSGLSSFNGRNVWYGHWGYYFHSLGFSHYRLLNGAWSEYNYWSGYSFSGEYIWNSPNSNIGTMYTNGGTNYELYAGSCKPMTTYSYTIDGRFVWSDSSNTYYSNESNQYKLISSGQNWTTQGWSGKNKPYGMGIWTYDGNTYSSNGNSQYVRDSSTWNNEAWNGITSFYGWNVWTDGTSYYYSDGTSNYILNEFD